MQYCNLWNPTATNWGACMTGSKSLPLFPDVSGRFESMRCSVRTGRAGGGDIVKLEAYCSGRQIMFPFPKVHPLFVAP